MIPAGFTMIAPLTGARTVVLETAAETGGMGFSIEVHSLAGKGPNVLEHLHESWTETFEIISGTVQYVLGGQHGTAKAGETVVMPAKVAHVHPWSAGPEDVVFRQHTRFAYPSADAVQDTLGSFATINGLAREGKCDAHGMPKQTLQLAATLRTLGKHGGYSTTLPIVAQQLISATLGRFAEAMGYRAAYPRYEVDAAK